MTKNGKIAAAVVSCLVVLFLLLIHSEEQSSSKAVPLPRSGTVLAGGNYYSRSSITVHASNNESCVVSLRNIYGQEVLCFFVRAGESITVGTPAEKLYVYFASGEKWYGYGESLMFGKNTDYFKDNGAVDFSRYTWEYKLYKTSGGNFNETPCSKSEFFN